MADEGQAGGPPIPSNQLPGCDDVLATQVQQALDCSYIENTMADGPLQAAMSTGEMANTLPFSCLVDILTGPYSNCTVDIPRAKRQAAYEAFSDITGYQPMNLERAFSSIGSDFNALSNFNAFYMFIPTLILLLVGIWLMVIFKWFNWVVGLFLSSFVLVILYGASVAYRVHFQTYLENRNKTVLNEARLAQFRFENSIAYWPQGISAAACAVTCTTGTTGCWTCNGGTICPPCNNPVQESSCAPCAAQELEDTEVKALDDTDLLPRLRRHRRNIRRHQD